MNVLFVCTGNVFRSMTAEKCLKDYASRNNMSYLDIDSAGTHTIKQQPCVHTVHKLLDYHIICRHHYKQISQQLIEWSDVIIAMNLDHQEFLQKEFETTCALFNQVAFGKTTGVLDFHEYNTHLHELSAQEKDQLLKEYAHKVVEHIYQATPFIAKNLHLFKNRNT